MNIRKTLGFAEKALVNNETFKKFISILQDFILILDENYKIIFLNPPVEKFYTHKLASLVMHPYDFICELSTLTPLLTEKEKQLLKRNKYLNCETEVTISNVKHTIEWLIFPVIEQSQINIALVGRDVTFLPENQNYTQKLQQYLEDIAACMPGNFYWKDQNGHYLGCNTLLLKTLNLTEISEIIGKTDADLWPTYAEELRKHDKMVMDTGSPYSLEEKITMPDGRNMYFAVIKTPLKDEFGNIIGVIGNSLDITNQKELEQQLRAAKEVAEKANELKSQFMQNMQHDMRTPTAGLFHLFDFIKKARSQEEFLEMLTLGENATKELLSLCDTLVDFESIHYGSKAVIAEKLSIHDMIQRVCNLNLAAIREKNIELIVDISEKVPNLVKGDDFRLYKILTNLLGNSIKFTLKGEIKITAQLVSIKKNKIVIEFGVHDTGPGIPADKIDLIFEKFVRLNPSNQGLYKGSGLGLSIVKKCVEELEGEIDVESEVGKGTSFYVTIPFEKALGSRPPRKANFEKEKHLDVAPLLQGEEIFDIVNMQITSPLRENKKNESLNVLLIEDDKLAATAAKAALISTHCQVTLAENVAEAIEKLNEQLFNLVVSDIGLPDGTGFDIITHVKNDSKHRNYTTPFIALTAHTSEDMKQKANATGFAHLFHKPINPQRIQTVLDIYLEERKEDQSAGDRANHEEESILDFELTQQLSGGREDVAKELLEMLVKITPDDLHALEQAIHLTDSKAAREVLHKIKGGLSYCGVTRFKHAIIHLHDQVKASEDVTTWKEAFQEVMKEWEHLVQAYNELIANKKL